MVADFDRKRVCSDVFARAMGLGESLAQAPQRDKKTWESKQKVSKTAEMETDSLASEGLTARLLRPRDPGKHRLLHGFQSC